MIKRRAAPKDSEVLNSKQDLAKNNEKSEDDYSSDDEASNKGEVSNNMNSVSSMVIKLLLKNVE